MQTVYKLIKETSLWFYPPVETYSISLGLYWFCIMERHYNIHGKTLVTLVTC